ncbi:MAG: NADH-quinone oxidoreductase subunit J [Bacteroidia bacterium]|nr:NADH-quinone oxidoreductase subunit J [Bacteroidia bacterium]
MEVLFWVLSLFGLAGGFGLILSRNPMYSVLFLVLNMFCIAGLYLLLEAEFLAIIQLIVYAGAIMVLFLFVVMLLNLGKEDPTESKFDITKGLAFILGIAFLGEMLYILTGVSKSIKTDITPFEFGKVELIGRSLMSSYLFPFEMISVILLAALMGAIVIARKHN